MEKLSSLSIYLGVRIYIYVPPQAEVLNWRRKTNPAAFLLYNKPIDISYCSEIQFSWRFRCFTRQPGEQNDSKIQTGFVHGPKSLQQLYFGI